MQALNGHAPSWALVSLSAVTALTLVALGTLLVANHRLANQVKQRDKVGDQTALGFVCAGGHLGLPPSGNRHFCTTGKHKCVDIGISHQW